VYIYTYVCVCVYEPGGNAGTLISSGASSPSLSTPVGSTIFNTDLCVCVCTCMCVCVCVCVVYVYVSVCVSTNIQVFKSLFIHSN